MKAAMINSKDNLSVTDIEKPVIKEGEALIKVEYCGICGSDIHILKGEHPTARFPVVPGHEFVGELVEINSDLSGQFKIGDKVVAQPFFSCGNCGPCSKGSDNVCESLSFMGAHRDGGFAEYVKVLARKMYKVPDEIEDELAALTEPIAVAVHDVRKSNLKVGESVLIIGGGPIGMFVAIIAENTGAGDIIISEISEERRAFAEELGYQTINPLDKNFNDTLSKITGGKGFDVVFEVSGSKPGIKTAIEYAKITGTVMIVGMSCEEYPVSLSNIFAKELNIHGVRIHNQYNFKGAIDILKQGACNEKFRKLISNIYTFDEILDAFEIAKEPGDYFKLLIKV